MTSAVADPGFSRGVPTSKEGANLLCAQFCPKTEGTRVPFSWDQGGLVS